MRYLVALVFPWLSFFTMGKVIQGILCLVLQLTIIGWLPATVWAFISISNYYADQRTDRIVSAISAQNRALGLPDTSLPARSRTSEVKVLIVVLFVILAGVAGWSGWNAYQSKQPAIGGPFMLLDQDGHNVTNDSLKGKPTLLYFGYTLCPDVCSTSLHLMEAAVKQLGPETTRKVNLVFITIDPERDTPKLLKGFVGKFGTTFVGLTGTPEQIAAAARAYRVYYQKAPGKDGAPYLIDHSSIIYLLDRNGQFVTHFTHESKAEQIAKALSPLL